MAKFKIELVRWSDSSTDPSGWKTTEHDLKEYKESLGHICEIFSVGYVIYEDDDVITLCGNLGTEAMTTEEYEFCSLMRIPKVCVIKRQQLKKKGGN